MTQDENDDDFDLFRQEMRGVKPIVHDDQAETGSAKPRPVPRSGLKDSLDVVDNLLTGSIDEIESGDEITYLRDGYQKRILQKLKRGQYRIEDELDLHGMTIDRARQRAGEFLNTARRQHTLAVLLVHGKGHSSEQNRPVLKNWLNGWLRQRGDVLAFCSARPADGGTGAVYVLLKPH